ncbi:hypothetical protein KR084_008664, partial [Drosophila pseudotakahashii]
SNFNPVLAFACLCVAVEAQTPRPSNICGTENTKCRQNERRLGRNSDVSNIFNNHCRQAPGNSNWRNVTRCELALASCRLTVERCAAINCANVRRSLGGGGPGGPPTPRTTTPRIPDTERPRTPSPNTRRTTTRRTPTTRTPSPRRTTTRRTTTRRTPTTRTPSPRRTTTRRPSED